MSLVFSTWFSKGEKEKKQMKGMGRTPALKFLGSHCSQGGGGCNSGARVQQWLPVFLHLCNQKHQTVVRAQIPSS